MNFSVIRTFQGANDPVSVFLLALMELIIESHKLESNIFKLNTHLTSSLTLFAIIFG